LVAWSTIYLTVLSLSILVYRLSPWHPLASTPGRKKAAATKWWMVYRILVKGGRHWNDRAHNKYGVFVRVGPNEVSVKSSMAVKPIYTQVSKKLVLDYQVYIIDRLGSVRMTAFSLKHHSQKRVKQLVEIFELRSVHHEELVLDHWFNLFFMDLMGDIGFSGGFETMKAGDDTEKWLEMVRMFILGRYHFILSSVMGQIPRLKSIFKLIPQPRPLVSFHKVEKAKEIKEMPIKQLRQDILSIIHSWAPPLSHDEVAVNAVLIVVATADISIQMVLSFFRYIMVDKSKQQKLQKEIDEVFVDMTDELDVNTLMLLPYLDACVQEALQIMPPGPFSDLIPMTLIITYRKWILPGTTLHVPVYVMHCDPINFSVLAEEFILKQWLIDKEISSSSTKDKLLLCNHDAFVPFSAGYSSYMGKHLALPNIK
ncbi:hypothetical protein M422DRAFT_188065, partial [Sphaerobolus stellatus SS14]